MSEPVTIEKKRKHGHWWQGIPRRLSLTRKNSEDEGSSGAGTPTHSPISASPGAENSTRRVSTPEFESQYRWSNPYGFEPTLFTRRWF